MGVLLHPDLTAVALCGSLPALLRTAQEDYGRNRAPEDLHVLPERAGIAILDIEHDALGIGRVRAAVDLPEAGDPGGHADKVGSIHAVAQHLLSHDRARPNDAHLASYHIKQLWQLVYAG